MTEPLASGRWPGMPDHNRHPERTGPTPSAADDTDARLAHRVFDWQQHCSASPCTRQLRRECY